MKTLISFLTLFYFGSLNANDFNKEVKPILSKNCFSCHGRDKQKRKLRLDIRELALRSKAFVPGNADKSLIIEKIFSLDEDEIMPPSDHGKLTKKEKEILKEWIESGAQYQNHWSFEPLQPPIIPELNNPWVTNPIDTFILKSLQKQNLNPAPQASKEALLRRLSLVLNGLPPSNDLKADFLNGKITFPELCQKLLSNNAYGEKMAVFWLDGARYADTNGIEYDNSRPIWPYRDWVINAFNSDMAYDKFIIEQIAGDLLPDPSISQIIATGFNRCHMTTNESGSIEEEFLVRYAKDRLNTVSKVFLGLTVGCAECHDHKYDPISQKEYYQMLAYFNNIEEIAVGEPFSPGNKPLIPVIPREKQKKLNLLNDNLAELKKQMASIEKKADSNFLSWHYSQLIDPPKAPFLIGKMDAYFALDELSGSQVTNLITEHKCNIKGPISRSKGKKNNALTFKGSTIIDCLNVCNYERNTPFSTGMWLKMKKISNGTPLAKFDSILKRGWKYYIREKELYFEILHNHKNGIKIKAKLNDEHFNKWIHVSATYDGSGRAKGCKLYINGEKINTDVLLDNLSGTILTKGNMRIGAESFAGSLLEVEVDEVFAIKNTLNQEELKIVSAFDSRSRFALVKPVNLSADAKDLLFKYYLEKYDKNHQPLFDKSRNLISRIDKIFAESPTSMVMKERMNIRETFVLERGNYQKKLEKVKRDIPQFLKNQNSSTIDNRLDLAHWIASKKNPLTARVMVNKIWFEIFGKHLMKSPGDFGIQGNYPDHPELLDYLASYLMQNDWSIKKLVQHIIQSSTFKQSSDRSPEHLKVDPNNTFYSSYPRHRLKAEFIRDQVLKISGKLKNEVGGEPVFPYQPEGLWLNISSISTDTRFYTVSKGNDKYKRSIYTFIKRSIPPPAMTIFNLPNRQICVVNRNKSNTPQQALVTLNDPQFTELYQYYFEKVTAQNLKYEETVHKLFDDFFQRKPNPREKSVCLSYIGNNDKNLLLLIHSLANTDEFLTVE